MIAAPPPTVTPPPRTAADAPAPAHPGRGRSGRRAAGPDLAAGLAGVAAVAAASGALLGLPGTHVLVSVGLYAVLCGLVLRHAPPGLPGPGLGAANRVTLARSTLALPVAALTLQPTALGEAAHWWIVALGTVAMVLDNVDGRIARRSGTATSFGARFDMEVDAFLLLALSVLTWQSGKVAAWVIAIGALRYLFVAAGRAWPVLEGELPPSFRRKAVCVVQGVALLVCLGPIVPAAPATGVAAVALGLLAWSFAVDLGTLAGSGRQPAAPRMSS